MENSDKIFYNQKDIHYLERNSDYNSRVYREGDLKSYNLNLTYLKINGKTHFEYNADALRGYFSTPLLYTLKDMLKDMCCKL